MRAFGAFDGDPRRRPWLAAAVFGLLAQGHSFGATDLTELSLRDLMNVEAAGPSSRFLVSATAIESCAVSAENHLFGTYDPLKAGPTDTTSIVTVICTIDSTYDVGLSAGIGAGASVSTRRMAADTQTLDYALYRDPGRAMVWGNSPGIDTVAGVGTGLPVDHPVYGRIAPRQAVRRGAYADVITITVAY